MKWISLRRLLLFVVSGCFAVVVLASTLANSQDGPKKLAPPRTDVIRTAADTKFFYQPTFGNWAIIRLDWCLDWATNCGKPAADAYCDSRGYLKALNFEIEEHVGHTATIGDGRLCNSPICNGFKTIECVGLHTIFEKPRIEAYDINNSHVMRMDWCLDWATNCGKPAADYYCKLHNFPRGARTFEIARNAGPTRTGHSGITCPNS